MLSTPVFDAASSSSRSTKRPASMSRHAPHSPHGVAVTPVLAVEALGEDARERRLADAARAGEQVGVVQAAARQRVGERRDDVLLPDQLAERAGPPLAGEDLVAHRKSVRPERRSHWPPDRLTQRDGAPKSSAWCDDAKSKGGEPFPRHLQ